MNIGSLVIKKEDNVYHFCNDKGNDIHNNSFFSLFPLLLQSFQLEHDSILYCANSIQTLDTFIESNSFSITNASFLLSTLYEQICFFF